MIIGLKLNDFGKVKRERKIPNNKKKFLEKKDDDRELQSESSGQV